MTHTSTATHDHWSLNTRLIPAGSVCPGTGGKHAATPSNAGRLIPFGSACPAPAESAADRPATHPRGIASSVIPPGSTCPEIPSDSRADRPTVPEESSNLGVRLVPAGSTCRVLSDREPCARLSQPTFSDAFLSNNRMPGVSRSAAIAGSMILQILLLSAVILVPLWFVSAPDLKNFAVTMLVAPPPPPAAPAPLSAPARVAPSQPAPRKSIVQQEKVVLPMAIPKHAATIREAPPPPEIEPNAVAGGVYGGLPADLTASSPSLRRPRLLRRLCLRPLPVPSSLSLRVRCKSAAMSGHLGSSTESIRSIQNSQDRRESKGTSYSR